MNLYRFAALSLVIVGLSSIGRAQSNIPWNEPIIRPASPTKTVENGPIESKPFGSSTMTDAQPVPQPPGASKTVYREIQKLVRVFNSAAGRWETQVVTERVPVTVGPVNPGGPGIISTGNSTGAQPTSPVGPQFILTVTNSLQTSVDLTVGSQRFKLMPRSSRRMTARAGQQYSYSGPARKVAPGSWVGGGTVAGRIGLGQRTLSIGNPPAVAQNGLVDSVSPSVTIPSVGMPVSPPAGNGATFGSAPPVQSAAPPVGVGEQPVVNF